MASSLLTALYMSFPKRLVAIRKAKHYTQASLAEATGIHVQQIKRYEGGSAQPSVDALIRLAKALAITTDELLFDEDERGPDNALRLHFEAVSKLSPEEQDTIISVIDGLLLKHEAQRWSQPRKRAVDKSSG
jgi:transcriptional regulator with XRE-family HTH domain